jgi:3-hydroxyacyl-[acyl-carrier-protein] dehydratase
MENRAPVMDVRAIQALIPHRYPFLLLDRVVTIESGKSLVAIKSVTVNEPFFQGHFPGLPVMPGVLIVEAMAQAGAILAMKSLDQDWSKKVAYLASLDMVKFRKPVVPGDRLELHLEVVKNKGAIWKEKGVAKVDGQIVAEAEFMAVLTDREG